MTDAGSATRERLDPFAFHDLRDAAPVYAALAVILVADAALDDDLAVVIVVVVVIAAMIGATAYRAAGAGGAARARARERFDAALDRTERRTRQGARIVPVAAAVIVGLVATDVPFDGVLFAVTAALGYLVGQVAFAVWLRARRTAVGR